MKFFKLTRTVTLLILCFCLASVCTALPCNAKDADVKKIYKGAQLSKSTLSMYPNTVKQLKLNNAASEVKWSSTDPKLVSILGSHGADRQTVTIKSGNKTGTCKIKAKIKGKTFTCKVTVKKDDHVTRAKLVKVKKTSEKITVKIKLCNRGKKEIGYGRPFIVEKFVDGSWKKVGPPDDWNFPCDIITVPGRTSKTISYVIATKRDKDILQYTKGTYRLTMNTNLKYNYVLFSL